MNPFRVIEKTLKIVGNTIGYLFIAFCFIVVGYLVAVETGMGWWVLLLIPGLFVAVILFWIVVAIFSATWQWIAKHWRRAKWDWDYKHRKEEDA